MAYTILHTGLFSVAAASLLYWALWIRPGLWKAPGSVEAVTATFGTLALTLISGVTVVDIADGGAPTPFLANLLVCAALALIPLPWAFVVYGVPTLVYFCGALALGPHDRHLATLRRSGHTASLVLVDLDRFKVINDKHGHPMGDLVLKEAARVLQLGVRDVDCVCRWGGEEFLILLADTPTAEAAVIAERLRSALAGARVGQETALGFTGSFGVTGLHSEGETPFQDAYSRVDAALYLAKAGGRNRVEVNPRPLGPGRSRP